MTVTGTEQRVYGTLVGGCIIDLHRFALVSGSTTQSPIEASTVTYADTTPYKQCGYKYAGYLTLFLSISGSSVYAAVEVRICKNDAKRIVIETYGEVAKTITGGMALWFNKGTNAEPDWVKLNSTNSGIIMPYATTSYTFKESKRNGSITIDCCKKCPSCGCKACSVQFYVMLRGTSTKIYPTSTLMYGYHVPPYGNQSCLWNISTVPTMSVVDWRCTEIDVNVPDNVIYDVYFEDPDNDDPLIGTFEWFRSDGNYEIVVEYTIECDDIKVWAYTLLDETNFQLSNLVGHPIRIQDACAGSSYVRGTIASISGSSSVVTISIPDVTVDTLSPLTGGTCIPSTTAECLPFPILPGNSFYTHTGYFPFYNVHTFRFHFSGFVPNRELGNNNGNTSINAYITTIRIRLNVNLNTDATGWLPKWALDTITTGWVTSSNGHPWRQFDDEILWTNPYYKTTAPLTCDDIYQRMKYYCRLSISLNSGTYRYFNDDPLTPAYMYVTMECLGVDGAPINYERCMTRIMPGKPVYID